MPDSKSSRTDLTRFAELADSPAARLARALEDSPTQRLIRETASTAAQRIEKATRAARLLEQEHFSVVAFLDKAEAIQRTLQNPEFVDGLARLQQQSSSMARAVESAVLPTASAVSSLSAELARAVEPYQFASSSIAAWETTLAARMRGLEIAWALPDRLGESMIGFARLSRLSDAVHTAEPYAEPVGELLADELGAGVEADVGRGANRARRGRRRRRPQP